MKTKVLNFLFKERDATTVSLFRIGFGIMMVIEMVYYLKVDFVYNAITGPQLLFKYPGLEFINPLPDTYMYIINVLLLLSAILITIGEFCQIAALFFFLGYTYFFLQDATYFNNHFYLISLLSFLLIFIDADKTLRFRNILKKDNPQKIKPAVVPNWNIWIIRTLLILVFFFSGLAKINGDWLSGEITKAMFTSFSKDSGLGQYLQSSFNIKLFAIGGMLFDLLIGFILKFKPTRNIGIIGLIIFNALNAIFWNDIGIFPYLMIAITIIFCEPETVSKFFHKEKKEKIKKSKKNKQALKTATPKIIENKPLQWNGKRKLTAGLLGLFILVQILFPLRHYVMTNNPDWTGVGALFAWRMKAQTRTIESIDMNLFVLDTGETQKVDTYSFLTANQKIHFVEDPRRLVQLARHVSKTAAEQGFPNLGVKADIKVSFNGREPQHMFSPELNLVEVDLKDPSWILPLIKK